MQMMAREGCSISVSVQEDIPDLTCAPLVEVASRLEKPSSPEIGPLELDSDEEQDHYADYEDDHCPYHVVPRVSVAKSLSPPPIFDFPAVQVVYFDLHGTLVDKELGVFEALKPLLDRSAYQFDRNEAVSFYLESEYEMKRRAPDALYAQILSDTYTDVALRLGIESVEPDSSLFAESFFHWPLISNAERCLTALRTVPGLSIAAIVDVDHESLQHSFAFRALAPYFDTVFTWDACAGYKPDLSVFKKPLLYHDALGVKRQNTCIVSGNLLADLEPALELGIPAIWMRHPQSLAENTCSWERAHPVLSFSNLADLAMSCLGSSNRQCASLHS
ncbi:HAD-like domain-containing protein [Mycena galopus ATCC 62051]|nr:HAD-like domain-containing protein [Mycena galopus ATCC 62051]